MTSLQWVVVPASAHTRHSFLVDSIGASDVREFYVVHVVLPRLVTGNSRHVEKVEKAGRCEQIITCILV